MTRGQILIAPLLLLAVVAFQNANANGAAAAAAAGAVSVVSTSAPAQRFASEAPLRFCTGGEGGFYEKLGTTIGAAITKQTKSPVEVLTTGGSVENAEKMKDGDCELAVMQSDAVISLPMPADVKVVDSHTEVVYWLHSKAGVDDFGKMDSDATSGKYAVAAVSGSGALVTMKNWVKIDKGYEGVRIVEFDDWYSAAEAVAQGYVTKAGVRIEIAGMLYVGRPGILPADITEDFGGQILVGEVNDGDFAKPVDANDNPLYSKCEVAETSGLKTSTMTKPDTYCMRAQVVFNNAYLVPLAPADAKKVRRAIDKGINSTVKVVR